MNSHLKNFQADETGAVTVDWVVLAAFIVALSLATMATFSDASTQTIAAMFASIDEEL